jgi:hypothetical protein
MKNLPKASSELRRNNEVVLSTESQLDSLRCGDSLKARSKPVIDRDFKKELNENFKGKIK